MKSFRELAELSRNTTPYHVQGAILDFTQEVVGRMECDGMNKAELAAKLSTSPAYITKLLGGDNNFTLETMVKVAQAVRADLKIHLQPKGSVSQWIDVLQCPNLQDHPSPCWPGVHFPKVIRFPTNCQDEEFATVS
jgi:transcriptional regulator with XRE-family HTH domain